MTRPDGLYTMAAPVTIPAYDPQPSPADGIDMVLTESERSNVAAYACALEDNRRKQNARDTIQQAAYELARGTQA